MSDRIKRRVKSSFIARVVEPPLPVPLRTNYMHAFREDDTSNLLMQTDGMDVMDVMPLMVRSAPRLGRFKPPDQYKTTNIEGLRSEWKLEWDEFYRAIIIFLPFHELKPLKSIFVLIITDI